MTEDLHEDESWGWGEPGRRPLNASEKQVAFARARIAGHTMVKAAELAGYKGSYEALRAVGSNVEKTDRVRHLIALARAGMPEEDLITDAELRRLMSGEIRRKGPGWVRCAELMSKHFHDKREQASPLEVVRFIHAVLDGAQARRAAERIGFYYDPDTRTGHSVRNGAGGSRTAGTVATVAEDGGSNTGVEA